MTTTALLELSGAGKRYGSLDALSDLDLVVEPGHVLGLLGPNGAGKTTALRLALGLARPSTGRVLLAGRPPGDPRSRSRVGYLPGDLALDSRLTGAAWLALLARLSSAGTGAAVERRRAQLCERLQLDADDLCRPIRDDSSGTRQKLGLVGACQHDPDLLVLDEPTNALDPLAREAVFELMREAGAAGKGVLHSSHVLSEVDRTATHVVILRRGRRVAHGLLGDLRQRLVRRMVVRFRGEPPVSGLISAGAELLEQDGRRLVLGVVGGLDRLLSVLAEHPVDELAFPEPDLAHAFSQFYAEQGTEP